MQKNKNPLIASRKLCILWLESSLRRFKCRLLQAVLRYALVPKLFSYVVQIYKGCLSGKDKPICETMIRAIQQTFSMCGVYLVVIEPLPFLSVKLSSIKPRQYLDGQPCTYVFCCCCCHRSMVTHPSLKVLKVNKQTEICYKRDPSPNIISPYCMLVQEYIHLMFCLAKLFAMLKVSRPQNKIVEW